jgi:hypothetical protein
MKLRELINETVRMKDEVKQRRTICQLGLENMKEDLQKIQARWRNKLNSDRLRIEQETDFKEKGMTNQKQRDTYITEMQKELNKEMSEEVEDEKFLIAQAEERELELHDEYKYYEDRLAMLMKIYDIEGEIELEENIVKDREVVGERIDDEEE